MYNVNMCRYLYYTQKPRLKAYFALNRLQKLLGNGFKF